MNKITVLWLNITQSKKIHQQRAHTADTMLLITLTCCGYCAVQVLLILVLLHVRWTPAHRPKFSQCLLHATDTVNQFLHPTFTAYNYLLNFMSPLNRALRLNKGSSSVRHGKSNYLSVKRNENWPIFIVGLFMHHTQVFKAWVTVSTAQHKLVTKASMLFSNNSHIVSTS